MSIRTLLGVPLILFAGSASAEPPVTTPSAKPAAKATQSQWRATHPPQRFMHERPSVVTPPSHSASGAESPKNTMGSGLIASVSPELEQTGSILMNVATAPEIKYKKYIPSTYYDSANPPDLTQEFIHQNFGKVEDENHTLFRDEVSEAFGRGKIDKDGVELLQRVDSHGRDRVKARENAKDALKCVYPFMVHLKLILVETPEEDQAAVQDKHIRFFLGNHRLATQRVKVWADALKDPNKVTTARLAR